MCYIKTKFVFFYFKYLQLLLLISKLHVSSSPFLVLQNSHFLNYPKSHHHDQNNKNSKFKLTKFPNHSLS